MSQQPRRAMPQAGSHSPTREDLIGILHTLASETSTASIPRHDFLRVAGVSERYVLRMFGTYNALVEAAGLQSKHFPSGGERTYSNEDLLDEVVRVLRMPDSKPTRIFFEQHATVSPSVCERRFGGWLSTLRLASDRLDRVLDLELIQRLAQYTSPALPATAVTQRRSTEPAEIEASLIPDQKQTVEHPGHAPVGPLAANVYGDFINFRGLQHAPVNEQGVVFLFGMVCRELGYVVEIVRSGFPDCEAKRRILGSSGKWQRVRIEFEFQARTFQSHGHDPDICDVIVCWEDNWPNAPLEVLELRSAIRRLAESIRLGS